MPSEASAAAGAVEASPRREQAAAARPPGARVGARLAAVLTQRIDLSRAAAAGIVLVAACLFCAAYVAGEDPAYYYDWGGYYNLSRDYAALLARGDLGAFVGSALASVSRDDYNPTSILPLSLVSSVFGPSRTVYITGVVTLYLVPAAILMAALAERLGRGDGGSASSVAPPLWMLLVAGLYWPLWASAMRGLPDVAGLAPLGAATVLVLYAPRFRARPILAGAALGLCLWLTFLLRRWYAFSEATLLVAGAAVWTWAALRAPGRRVESLIAIAKAAAACGLAAGLLLAAFQGPLVARILGTSYAQAYAAYQAPLAASFGYAYGLGGPLIALGAAAGLVRAAIDRRWRILSLAACTAASFLFFTRTQAPGVQHILPWSFWLFPSFVYGAGWPFARLPGGWRRSAWIVPALMLLSFASIFSPAVRARAAPAAMLLPPVTMEPLRIENFPTYRRLTEELAVAAAPPARITVLASDGRLNGSLLEAIDWSLRGRLGSVGDIDLRDGLYVEPLRWEFAVATDAPSVIAGQRVMAAVNGLVRSGTALGAGYEEAAGPFELGGGVTARVYRRVRPLSDEDVADLEARVLAMYPDWTRTPAGLAPR